MIGLTAAGVGARWAWLRPIYLEEYAPRTRLSRFIELNIANLAGVPSVVYGILGFGDLRALVRPRPQCDRSVRSDHEPADPAGDHHRRPSKRSARCRTRLRLAALRHRGDPVADRSCTTCCPSALPGILTGVILAISRAIGETAPTDHDRGTSTFVAFVPESPRRSVYRACRSRSSTGRPRARSRSSTALAAAGIIVLLAVLLLATNLVAVLIRHRAHRKP